VIIVKTLKYPDRVAKFIEIQAFDSIFRVSVWSRFSLLPWEWVAFRNSFPNIPFCGWQLDILCFSVARKLN